MLRELLSILRSNDPLGSMGADFSRMLQITCKMTLSAGEMYFGQTSPTSALRTRIYKQDVEVNKLERSIRKRVVAHLSLHANRMDLPYCLFLVGLVKDVERIGDYAKNISEVSDFYQEPLPDDPLVNELLEIRNGVEEMFRSASQIFSTEDREQAVSVISNGRNLAHRADALIVRIAHGEHNSGVTTALVLGTRYYKRIGGHVINVLSSVVMPLHKVDFFDEDELRKVEDDPA
jgi:phosphate uptake regulator